MDIFDRRCKYDDETEYIGWGDGNATGYGHGAKNRVTHCIPHCETFLYNDEWEIEGYGAGLAKGSGMKDYGEL